MRRWRRRIRAALAAAVFSVASPALAEPSAFSDLDYIVHRPLSVQNIVTLSAFPLDSPPIAGFIPHVVYGLTNQQAPSDLTFSAKRSTSPGGSTLPVSQTPAYFLATFDTGAQAHVVRYDHAQVFDLWSANRAGGYEQEIVGAGGSEWTDISDGLGIYMTGMGNASSSGSSLSVTPGTLRGQWNTAILTTQIDSVIPSLIGTPMMAQYQTVIRNSQTVRLNHDGQTIRGPQVEFQNLDTALPAGYYRLTLDLMSAQGVSPDPVFIPSFDNFNNWADNPTTPSFWASPFARVNGSHTGGDFTNEQFLFDTGAQVTVFSQDTAAHVGYYSGGPNPSEPDFHVEVLGVGGTIHQVPGFYLQELSVMTNGGPLVWTNVPVLVLDLPDPRDAIGFVPGILGMNLFTDRDLIVNGGTTNPHVGISLPLVAQWNNPAGGIWGGDLNWILGVPDQAGAPANFLGVITSPHTVTVEADYTIGNMRFDNVNTYTIAGPGRLTVQGNSPATITVSSGSHTLAAPLTLASDTTFNIASSSALTVATELEAAGVSVVKSGAGTLVLPSLDAQALNLSAGRVVIAPNGTASGVVRLDSLTIAGDAALDLNDNDVIVDYTGASPYTQLLQWVLDGYRSSSDPTATGIVSSTSQAQGGDTILVLLDNAVFDGAFTDWLGYPIDFDTVIGKYTYFGDANLDGQVTGDDFALVVSNLGMTAGTHWVFGDMNFDGQVTGDDVALVIANLGKGVGSPLGAMVPEPAGLGMILPALLWLRRRRIRSAAE